MKREFLHLPPIFLFGYVASKQKLGDLSFCRPTVDALQQEGIETDYCPSCCECVCTTMFSLANLVLRQLEQTHNDYTTTAIASRPEYKTTVVGDIASVTTAAAASELCPSLPLAP